MPNINPTEVQPNVTTQEQTTGVTEQPQAEVIAAQAPVAETTDVQTPAVEAVLVEQPIVETVVNSGPALVRVENTAADVYNNLKADGTPLEKGMLDTLNTFVERNSGPFSFGLQQAVDAQHALLSDLLVVLGALSRKDMRRMWTAITYVASLNSKHGAAFSETSVFIGTQYWRWSKERYEMYHALMILVLHTADPERSKSLGDYVSRKSLEKLEFSQQQRDAVNDILTRYGVK